MGAFFLEGFFAGLVGRQAGGPADVVLVVPVDWDGEQLVGRRVGVDFFCGQERDEAVLEGVEAAFDFAFGGGIGGDAGGDAQRGESALELRVGVEAVRRGPLAAEGPSVGVEAGGQARFFEGGA